jgi:hypothetical protein
MQALFLQLESILLCIVAQVKRLLSPKQQSLRKEP